MMDTDVVLFGHSVVSNSVTPWTAAQQSPLSCGLPHTDRFSNLESYSKFFGFQLFSVFFFKL